jgi:amino acid transporter
MKADDQVDASEDRSYGAPTYEKDVARTPSSDAEVGHGELVPEETTKRGLKARHAQMIALGGTIGKQRLCTGMMKRF